MDSPTPSEMDALSALALDMRWSWEHGADDLWKKLDADLWEVTRNPWLVLQSASQERVRQVLADPAMRQTFGKLVA
jgi:starch phosphorylase